MLSDKPVRDALGMAGASAISTLLPGAVFANHPELLDGTFNRGNQAAANGTGTGRIGRRVHHT